MVNDSDRISQLEARVAELERQREDVASAETDLLEAARQWARLTKLNYVLETGARDGERYRLVMNQRDADDLAETFMARMRQAAVSILRAETT